jgi:hypothetical protein
MQWLSGDITVEPVVNDQVRDTGAVPSIAAGEADVVGRARWPAAASGTIAADELRGVLVSSPCTRQAHGEVGATARADGEAADLDSLQVEVRVHADRIADFVAGPAPGPGDSVSLKKWRGTASLAIERPDRHLAACSQAGAVGRCWRRSRR